MADTEKNDPHDHDKDHDHDHGEDHTHAGDDHAGEDHGGHEGGHGDPFDPAHLFAHVQDATYFEVPRMFTPDGSGHLEIPQPVQRQTSLIAYPAAMKSTFEPMDLKITKFMVLEVVAAMLVAVLFIGVAARARSGERPRGRLWNMFESMLVFIRDNVARPAIGHHDADRFLPFLWTMFFFILFCNLMGLLPWLGTATAALATTGALAIITLAVVAGAGMSKLGFVGFFKAQVPHMDVPMAIGVFLLPMIFLIEILGLLIKHFVLAIRLLANMLAGHLVLAVLLAFILAVGGQPVGLFSGITAVSVLGATALCLLELLVAFIQAYIFTFLAALFIGMAVHPH